MIPFFISEFIYNNSMEQLKELSIYEKYGGFEFFHKIIYELYLELFDHPEIAFHFVGVDIFQLSKLQTQYLSEAIGGPKMYEGRPIKPVHSGMGITPYQMEVVEKRFGEIFVNAGLTKEEVEFIMTFVASKRHDIVTRKSSWIDKVMKPWYKFIYGMRKKWRKLVGSPT